MHDIAILAYPGCVGITVFGLADLLLIANHLAVNMGMRHLAPFSTRIVAVRSGEVALAGGMRLQAKALRHRPHLLVVPGLEVGRFGQWPLQAPGKKSANFWIPNSAPRRRPLPEFCGRVTR